MLRLECDRRCAPEGLQVRHHAEDLLIGEADRRLVDGGHARIESRHDEGVRFVHGLGEVLDIAQTRLADLRAGVDSREVRKPQRSALTDRVAGEAEPFALHDLPAHLHHVRRRQVAFESDLGRRLNFLLRHHLADVGIKRGRCDDQPADPRNEGDRHVSSASCGPVWRIVFVRRWKSGRSCRLVIQNTTPIRRKNSSTVTETTFVAKPSVGVNASGERSRMTPYTCQCWRSPDRMYPMSPISHVNVTAMKMRTYCETLGILPQRTSPVLLAPWNRKTSITVIEIMAIRTELTCGTDRRMRTVASTK